LPKDEPKRRRRGGREPREGQNLIEFFLSSPSSLDIKEKKLGGSILRQKEDGTIEKGGA